MTKTTCDACGRDIHLVPGEDKFRVDLHRPKLTRGYDVCGACFERIAAPLLK